LEDLISEGNLGLIRAARRFEPSRGGRFLSCAVWWIRKSILDALELRGALIRVPRYQQQKSRDVLAARSCVAKEISFDSPLSDGSSRTVGDVLPDSSVEGPLERLLRLENQARVRRAVRRLTPREIRVLSWRFGFGGREVWTLEEVGRKLGISREAVRQIEARARGKLAKQLRAAAATRNPSNGPQSHSGSDTASAQ